MWTTGVQGFDTRNLVFSASLQRTLRERRLFDVDVEVILADDAMIESRAELGMCRDRGLVGMMIPYIQNILYIYIMMFIIIIVIIIVIIMYI